MPRILQVVIRRYYELEQLLALIALAWYSLRWLWRKLRFKK
jgi:hypothetical protein